MGSGGNDAHETATQQRAPLDRPGRAHDVGGPRSLRLWVGGRVVTEPMPESGARVVGRGAEAEVRFDDASVSRRHARFHADGDGVSVEDLGSRNGTFVDGVRLGVHARSRVGPAQVVVLGSVPATVVGGPPHARVDRSVGSRELLEALERAVAEREDFVVVTVSAKLFAAHLDALAGLMSPRGHLADLEGSRLALLLPGMSKLEGSRWIELVGGALGLGSAELGGSDVLGFPSDGSSADELAARLRLERTSPAPAPESDSPGLANVHQLVDRVAPTLATLLILGETGVGKEVLARRVHDRSKRAAGPFLALNCAALPESLLESELFGAERGAFTGAVASRRGLIEASSGGTLFLDELGEMPAGTQAKLLRVLEEREVLRIGSTKPVPVDLRVLAATNVELEELVRQKRFRADLFYRLSAIVVTIPPLRERKGDIAALAKRLASRVASAVGVDAPTLSPELVLRLERYAWPGNVRELRNAMERVVLLAQGPVAHEDLLPETILRAAEGPPTTARRAAFVTVTSEVEALPSGPPPSSRSTGAPLDAHVAEVERQHIASALEQYGGNLSRTAEALGITRGVLSRKMEKYGLGGSRSGG